MTASHLVELKSFLSGYFHEDWELDALKADEVLSQFLNSSPSASEIDTIVAQIGCYLDSSKDDAAIERGLFLELGCHYLPGADGRSARDWMQHLASVLTNRGFAA